MLKVLAIGAPVLYLGYKYLFKKPAYQAHTGTSPTGTPVTVLTPVGPSVTPSQALTTPKGAPIPNVPTLVPGRPATVAPAGTPPAQASTAPIIVTPTGSASTAISDVKGVQSALNTLGYMPKLAVDGALGPITIGNIKQFQSKVGLTTDGNAGPATKAALVAALSSLAGGGSSVGAAVQSSVAPPNVAASAATMSNKDVQHALNQLGASPSLTEDGVIGPMSVAAIKSFQMSHGLVADGVAGPKTKTALMMARVQSSDGGGTTVSPVAGENPHSFYGQAWA